MSESNEATYPHVVTEAEAARHGLRQILIPEPLWPAVLMLLDMRGLVAIPTQFGADDLPTYITQPKQEPK